MHTETETPTPTPTPTTHAAPTARIAPSAIDVELIARQRSEHSARMSRYWQDPEWRENLTKKMKAYRSQKRVKARMRDKLLDSARERVKKTGVLPQWTPKKVAALEPSGKWITYDSIRQCAAHYGVKESNMRALIKFKRVWKGMRFVVSVEK
jgi:hypothetical protein